MAPGSPAQSCCIAWAAPPSSTYHMTSAPCQQCPYCGALPPSGCVECGAPHWTAPRLCVISCRKPSGHQPHLDEPGAAAPSRLNRTDVNPPRLWTLAEPETSPDAPITVSPRPYSLPPPERLSASTIASRGPDAPPRARWTAPAIALKLST